MSAVAIESLLPWMLAALAAGAAWLLLQRGATLQARLSAASARQHELEQQGHEREQMFRSLLDASPLALLLLQDDGKIAYENESARQLFFEGRTGQGENFLRLVAAAPETFRAALLGASDEIVGLTVQGQRETYHFARRSFEHRGQLHTLLVVRPMTREVARHDIEALRKLVRLISHEVNNSLAPISSLMHTARTVKASGERLERLERVFDAVEERARHLSNFIAGYASLARLPPPVAREQDLEALLNRLSLLYPDARLSAAKATRGYFDAAQIEQVLINLLKNANEAGGPSDAVALEVSALPEGAIEIAVRDRGRGFTPESFEHALMPFYTTKPGGTGVGLALVREVVHAHDGQLTLAAREGGGATISVLLPGRRPSPELGSRARLTLTRH